MKVECTNIMLHFNSEHHFCLQCRQRVQTLQTSDSVISVTHTKALECEMSLHYCYIHFSFHFCFSGTLFHHSAQCSGVLPVLSKPSGSAGCTDETHIGSALLVAHTSACCPECLIDSQIWSCYTFLKVLFNHYRHQYLKHWENTNKREKKTNYSYLWLWDAVSLCCNRCSSIHLQYIHI